MALFLPPTQNAVQYTLDTGYTAGGSVLTLSATLTGVIQAPGVCVVDRIDASRNKTSGKREYFTFTGVSGQQLTGCTGGLAGSTAQDHAVGAIVEFTPDVLQQQAIYDAITAEHDTSGKHTNINPVNVAASLASSSMVFTPQMYASAATVGTLTTDTIKIGTLLNFSGASIVGFPSGASGSVLTAIEGGVVFAPAGATSTGGLNALFQVPGGLASQANIGGLIPVPATYTIGFAQAFVQTPASVASVSATILKNNAVIGVVAVLAGATFASSASFSNTALVAGDELRLNINSTASLADSLSVLIRAT